MSEAKRVLLLVGSARRPQSTSETLGAYLLKRLGEQGWEAETVLLHRAVQSEDKRQALLAQAERADVIVLAFPLYVDGLPATVVRALELIHEHRAEGARRSDQRLLAIVNCGFPEAKHNHMAVAICRQFAQQADFEWLGGLILGGGGVIGGGAISGRPLEEVGAAHQVVRALDLAASAIAAGEPLPPKATEAFSKPVIPAWAYRWMGWLGWRLEARRNGVLGRLRARPYQV